jgi:hypothetical protein
MRTLNMNELDSVAGGFGFADVKSVDVGVFDIDGDDNDIAVKSEFIEGKNSVGPLCGVTGGLLGVSSGLIVTGACTFFGAGFGFATGACPIFGTFTGVFVGGASNALCVSALK